MYAFSEGLASGNSGLQAKYPRLSPQQYSSKTQILVRVLFDEKKHPEWVAGLLVRGCRDKRVQNRETSISLCCCELHERRPTVLREREFLVDLAAFERSARQLEGVADSRALVLLGGSGS